VNSRFKNKFFGAVRRTPIHFNTKIAKGTKSPTSSGIKFSSFAPFDKLRATDDTAKQARFFPLIAKSQRLFAAFAILV
jgi:hypothetical protein